MAELYVIGRFKDIIIVGGQNVFPEDVEMVVNTVAEIYPGRVVSFGVPNEQYQTESLVVVAELRGNFDAERAKTVERQVQQLVFATIGVAARFVRVVPERWIVKSTAGEISRRETKERFYRKSLIRIVREDDESNCPVPKNPPCRTRGCRRHHRIPCVGPGAIDFLRPDRLSIHPAVDFAARGQARHPHFQRAAPARRF